MGVAPYQGYEYQIAATVYLALELILRQHCTSTVTIEPADGEDIATALENVPAEKAVSTVQSTVQTLEFRIQIKLRRSGQWTPAAFREVLSKQADDRIPSDTASRSRIRPIEFLQRTTNGRFLLLTDAQVSSELKPFCVADCRETSAAAKLPDKCPGDSSLAARIGILSQLGDVIADSAAA